MTILDISGSKQLPINIPHCGNWYLDAYGDLIYCCLNVVTNRLMLVDFNTQEILDCDDRTLLRAVDKVSINWE